MEGLQEHVMTRRVVPIDDGYRSHTAVGVSPVWRDVLKRAGRVAATETTACVQGESGSGKEIVARFIHNASPRRRGPFVAINCAALPEQLFESELFGFERGAFTGAQQAKPGQIELAAGGTLFLDEVTEMTPMAQAKFLRVLEEREFLRLGGTRLLKANVRVIAATNRDLASAVAQGKFREDLYYRINVFDIRIPPLRERREDILLLADTFLESVIRLNGIQQTELSPEAKAALVSHGWPGNVRELRNVIERAAIVCDDAMIQPVHLSLRGAAPDTTQLNDIERNAIERVLHEVTGNKLRAARKLGISRTQLYTRLRKYGLATA